VAHVCAGVSSLVEEFTPYRKEEEVSVSYNGQSIKKWVHMRHLSGMWAQILIRKIINANNFI
jgi:hypothetical protein